MFLRFFSSYNSLPNFSESFWRVNGNFLHYLFHEMNDRAFN